MSESSSDGATTARDPAVGRNPVAADGKTLLAAFSKKQSVKFTDFRDTWNEMQFCYVYCAGGDHQARRKEIVLCLYIEGLRYLTYSSRPDHERVAGLFILYAVYCTQPVDPKALVRVTPDDWASLEQLQDIIKEKEYAEASYVLNYMRSQKAFNITATQQQKCLCLSSGDHTNEQLYQNFLTGPRSLHPHFLTSLSQDIQQCMEDYCSAKEQRKLYFPQHLLNTPPLPQQMSKIVEDYTSSVTSVLQKHRENQQQ